MNSPFFDELESEIGFQSAPSAQKPASANPQAPVSGERPGKGRFRSGKPGRSPQQKKPPQEAKRRGPKKNQKPLPKNVAAARSAAADSGVLVVVFLAESERRALLQAPRIESRGFFFPHEIREGHKFLVSESRRSYEETLKDVPDIETKDLEKIVKKDVEKALGQKFSRTPLVIATVLTA